MRIVWPVLALSLLSGCIGSGRAWHKEQSLKECGQIIDAQERAMCRQQVKDAQWELDKEAQGNP